MSDKKFSVNEVVELCKILISNPFEKSGKTYQELVDTYTKSLQQTEWEVEIEMEVIPDFNSRSDQDGSIFTSNKKEVPKLDADSCLILKRK